jgi:hypothetical protein
MKKTTTFFILLILFYCKVNGQEWVWAKSFQNNDVSALYNTFIDSNKNIYTIGTFNTATSTFETTTLTNSSEAPPNQNVQYTDAYITKHDSNGNLVFVKHFNGSKFDSFSAIAYDGADNFYVTGYYNGNITLGTNTYESQNNETKSFIGKFDLNGNVVWTKPINFHGNSILKYKNGFLYLAGIHSGNTYTYDALVTPSANYAAVVDFMDKTFVAKLDLSGNAIWLKSSTYNGTSSIQNAHRIGTQPKGLTIDNNGNVFIAGSFFSNSTTFGTQTLTRNVATNNANLFIAKYDSAGNFGWASSATTSSGSHSTVSDIQADGLNNVYLTGTIYNSNANFSGSSISFIGNSGSYLTKYTTSGAVSWVKGGRIATDIQPNTSLGSNYFDKIYFDANNNIYVSGVFYGYINFGNNYFVQNPNFIANLFSVKFDQSGVASNYFKIADASQSREVKILDFQGSTYYYTGRLSDPSLTLGTITLQNTSSGQTYIAKRDASLSIDEFTISNSIYPNPATSTVTISNFQENTICTLFDLTGKKVKQISLNQPSFSVEDLANGIYVLQLENDLGKENIKLVKN